MSITHALIFYIGRKNGWVEQHLDEEENQVGEALYYYRKADAIRSSRQIGVPVHIFDQNGKFQKII